MTWLFSDFSDMSFFFNYSSHSYLILDITNFNINVEHRENYFTKVEYPFLYKIDAISLVIIYFIALVFQVSYIIMREFFIEAKSYFFNRKQITFWLIHITVRVCLNLLLIPVYCIYVLYTIIKRGLFSFFVITYFCIIFVSSFLLFNTPLGVFFLFLTLSVYGMVLIFYFKLNKTLYYIKFYWKGFESKYDSYHRLHSPHLYQIYSWHGRWYFRR